MTCPIEWGAWRSGLAVMMIAAENDGRIGHLSDIGRAIDAMCAAGWSR